LGAACSGSQPEPIQFRSIIMSDTKGQHTNMKESQPTSEKKDVDKQPKARAGASGPGTDNTSAGSGGRGGHRRRGGPQQGK
jgi:hypothetical protein